MYMLTWTRLLFIPLNKKIINMTRTISQSQLLEFELKRSHLGFGFLVGATLATLVYTLGKGRCEDFLFQISYIGCDGKITKALRILLCSLDNFDPGQVC